MGQHDSEPVRWRPEQYTKYFGDQRPLTGPPSSWFGEMLTKNSVLNGMHARTVHKPTGRLLA